MTKLRNILVANRGEIAVRILRTARAMGYRTTAIYSEADAGALHVQLADDAIPIGPAPVAASYLNIARIVAAAQQAGADAVHPGYGLLSENAAFARACAAAGLTFIGPQPDTIELMGDKRRARIAVHNGGVPCVPGYDGEDQSDVTLAREAERIGYPIMVKAAAGGGGRGMRRVTEPSGLAEAIARARSEALKAFGDDRLILERALSGARHVEVQVFADRHGHVIHLGERDCSLQRRFQKVIEEAPSPAVDAALRARLGEVAVLAARSAHYIGAGTVELLLDGNRAFYFLEMNTRIQVEHPVTELITGIDLVAWQLRIAEGEALPLTQEQVQLRGHAIEARLYAEQPERGFTPATGRVLHVELPDRELARVDHALSPGLEITPHYDALLAKVVAVGSDRAQALRRLSRALDGLSVLGVPTNRELLRNTLAHPGFAAGDASTDFLEQQPELAVYPEPSAAVLAAAAYLFSIRPDDAAYPSELSGFSNSFGLRIPLVLDCNGRSHELQLEAQRHAGQLAVHIAGERIRVGPAASSGALLIEGRRTPITHTFDRGRLLVQLDAAYTFTDVTHRPAAAAEATGSGRAVAPMDGAVVDVAVSLGQRVLRGQTLMIVEAMKLELKVIADIDGVVRAVHAQRGAQVKSRQVLVELTAL